MEEIDKILAMLEKGKLSSEDAIQLIEALKKAGPDEGDSSRVADIMDVVGPVISETLSMVPKIVRSSTGDLTGSTSFSERFEMKGCNLLDLRSTGSTLTLKGHGSDFTQIEGEGLGHRVERKRDTLILGLASSEAELKVPKGLRYNLMTAGSYLKAEDIEGILHGRIMGSEVTMEFGNKLEVLNLMVQGSELVLKFPGTLKFLNMEAEISGSDVRFSGLLGKVEIKGSGSDFDIRPRKELESLEMQVRASKVALSLPKDMGAELIIETKGGKTELPEGTEIVKEEGDEVRVLVGEEPDSTLTIRNDFGTVEVK
jgi:hypothetical protein